MLEQYELDTAHAIYQSMHGVESMKTFNVEIEFEGVKKIVAVESATIMNAMNEIYVNRVRVLDVQQIGQGDDGINTYSVKVDVDGEVAGFNAQGRNPYEVLHNVSAQRLKVIRATEASAA